MSPGEPSAYQWSFLLNVFGVLAAPPSVQALCSLACLIFCLLAQGSKQIPEQPPGMLCLYVPPTQFPFSCHLNWCVCKTLPQVDDNAAQLISQIFGRRNVSEHFREPSAQAICALRSSCQ